MLAEKNGSDSSASNPASYLSKSLLSDRGGRVLRSSVRAAPATVRLQAPPLPQRRVRKALQGSSISGATVASTVDKIRPIVSGIDHNGRDGQLPAEQNRPGAGKIGQLHVVGGDGGRRENPAVTIQFEEALQRTQRALDLKKAALRNTREELGIAKEELKEVREEVADLTERLEAANASKEQYRNWWINEVQFTKLILNKVPHPNQDWDLVRTSQSHYLGRF
ncbi:hypothetical protein BKA70DRAFT_1446864 [Coprinopsis sp. MPI-PUGE-AT-0042]|nr:hypothetical protein BKA70DRAFT_1446864 [Coprinopsis sp. MPI-PUGE-AT-0042]